MASAIFWMAYIILCVVGLHVAVNYLCSIHSTRAIQKKDILFALACIFLNVIVLILVRQMDKAKVQTVAAAKLNHTKSIEDMKDALSIVIPYFNKKRHTVAALIHSGNPYAFLLGMHLKDKVGKDTSYTLTDNDIVEHGHVAINASRVDVVNAKYDQEQLNKRDI